MNIVGRKKSPKTGNHELTERERIAERRAAEARINRTLLLVMAVLLLLTAVVAVSQASFVKNGSITVLGSAYSVIEPEPELKADAAAALNSKSPASMRIEITVPEYCPVSYKANAPIAMVYDKTDEAVLYSKNESEKCCASSVAKLMTAAVALDLTPDGYQFVAGEELDLVMADAPMAKINKCFAFNRTEITDGIILKGGSDVSYTAAACVGRMLSEDSDISAEDAVDEFVNALNTTARNIGADNTRFANPDGYYDEGSYTTASDMMKISLYALDHKEIASSAAKERAGGKLASGQSYEWLNTNNLVVKESDIYYEYATGLKTGMDQHSGYCAAASAERYGHTLVCVVMNCPDSSSRSEDIRNLFDISFSYLEQQGDCTEAEDTSAPPETLEG